MRNDGREAQRVERYTSKVREESWKDQHKTNPSRLKRLGKALESIGRRALYALLRAGFRNAPLQGRVVLRPGLRVLIIPWGDAIGDAIVATPLVRIIKRRCPQAVVGLFVSDRNRSLFSADRDIDAQHVFAGRSDNAHYGELREARAMKYDVVLNLHLDKSTDYGLIANYVAPRAVKASLRHQRRELYRTFFNYFGQRERHTAHMTQYTVELLEEVLALPSPVLMQELRPSLVIPETTRASVAKRAQTLLEELGASAYVIVNIQARYATREWPLERIIQLGERLNQRYPGLAILLTADPTRLQTIKPIFENHPWIRPFETSRDLLELAALVAGANAVITPDTSLVQFASALNVPVVTLLHDRERVPIEWLPIQTASRLVAPSQTGQNVQHIEVEPVFEAVASLLDSSLKMTQTRLDTHSPQCSLYQANVGAEPLHAYIHVTYS